MVYQTTVAYVPKKSIPSNSLSPDTHNQALDFFVVSLVNCLYLKAKVPSMTLMSSLNSTTSQAPIPSKVSLSFSASFHYSSANGSFVA